MSVVVHKHHWRQLMKFEGPKGLSHLGGNFNHYLCSEGKSEHFLKNGNGIGPKIVHFKTKTKSGKTLKSHHRAEGNDIANL